MDVFEIFDTNINFEEQEQEKKYLFKIVVNGNISGNVMGSEYILCKADEEIPYDILYIEKKGRAVANFDIKDFKDVTDEYEVIGSLDRIFNVYI